MIKIKRPLVLIKISAVIIWPRSIINIPTESRPTPVSGLVGAKLSLWVEGETHSTFVAVAQLWMLILAL